MKETRGKKDPCIGLRLPRFALQIGEWKNGFREPEYMLMIVNALNACIHAPRADRPTWFKAKIAGYLVTTQAVFVVADTKADQISWMIESISDKIAEEITNLSTDDLHEGMGEEAEDPLRWHVTTNEENESSLVAEQPAFFRHPWPPVFEQIPFANYELVKLITGCKIDPGYYSPELAWLKEQVKRYPYCSAIDYLGGEGPVELSTSLVTLKRRHIKKSGSEK